MSIIDIKSTIDISVSPCINTGDIVCIPSGAHTNTHLDLNTYIHIGTYVRTYIPQREHMTELSVYGNITLKCIIRNGMW